MSNGEKSIVAFHFQGTDLLVPDSRSDAEAAFGFDISRHSFPALPMEALSTPFDVPLPDGSASLRLFHLDPSGPTPSGWRRVGTRSALLAAAESADDARFNASRLFRACHIAHWRAESAFCGRCGSPNGDASDEFARLCPRCGKREYPRISPAIIVLVTDAEGRALLAHNVKFKSGMHSLIAGFVEAGERLEEAVSREVREEVGIEVSDIRYVASQPWPFPDSLMLGFRAEYAGGTLKPDGLEITDAAWYGPNELPLTPSKGSVAHSIIETWLAESQR